jgi:DNA-binding response OmpR family regulator
VAPLKPVLAIFYNPATTNWRAFMAPKNVLIVEDDIIIAIDLQILLEKNGYNICAVANSGEEALKEAAQHRPDVVLMDIKLQGKAEGLLAGHEIHSTWNIPVIFMSGYLNTEKSINDKSIMYIKKPIEPQFLLSAIETILTKSSNDSAQQERDDMQDDSEIQNALKAQLLWMVPVPVAFQDKEQNIIWANKAHEEATGLSLQEMVGKKCYSVWGLSRSCRNCPVVTAIAAGMPCEAELTPLDSAKRSRSRSGVE